MRHVLFYKESERKSLKRCRHSRINEIYERSSDVWVSRFLLFLDRYDYKNRKYQNILTTSQTEVHLQGAESPLFTMSPSPVPPNLNSSMFPKYLQ